MLLTLLSDDCGMSTVLCCLGNDVQADCLTVAGPRLTSEAGDYNLY